MDTPGKGLARGTPAYAQARNNGFGKPGAKVSAREQINAELEQVILEEAPAMARQALEVFKQSMNSKDPKLRLQAAAQYFKTGYRPTQQVDLNVNDNSMSEDVRAAADALTPQELAILDRVAQGLAQHRTEAPEEYVVEEAEVVVDEGTVDA